MFRISFKKFIRDFYVDGRAKADKLDSKYKTKTKMTYIQNFIGVIKYKH